MTETLANRIAEEFRGEPYRAGSGVWIVRFRRADGGVVVLSDECVTEYEDERSWEEGWDLDTIYYRG